METMMTKKQEFQAKQANRTPSDPLFNFQKQALQTFESEGFPTKKHEQWLYWTPDDLHQAFTTPYDAGAVEASESKEIVIENGRLKTLVKKEGLSVTTQISTESVNSLKDTVTSSSLAALNSAQFNELITITLTKSIETPIIIRIKANFKEEKHASVSRVNIDVKENVKATISVYYDSNIADDSVINSTVECHCQNGSSLDIHHVFDSIETSIFSHHVLQVHGEATCNQTSIVNQPNLVRQDTEASIHHEKASLNLRGVALLNHTNQYFNHITVNHIAGNATSSQLFKTILTDKAVSEFSGLVFVPKGSHETDSTQLNQNLLLSDNARVLSRPQLRIDADDVVCAHGSTVGQLNPEEIHYIRSRGLTKDEAKSLLLFGFVEEVIMLLTDPQLKSTFDERFKEQTRNIGHNVTD